jgi:hypothetical protein
VKLEKKSPTSGRFIKTSAWASYTNTKSLTLLNAASLSFVNLLPRIDRKTGVEYEGYALNISFTLISKYLRKMYEQVQSIRKQKVSCIIKKVKQSRYWPGVAQRVPGIYGSQIS